MLTSQQELAIWQPAWPTIERNTVSKASQLDVVDEQHGAVCSASKAFSPLILITSLILTVATLVEYTGEVWGHSGKYL